METKTFTEEHLRNFTTQVFLKMGVPADDAALAADVLIKADIRGIDSHGVARLAGYVRLWEAKRINATPNIKVLHETPSTASIDADAALGLVSAPKAMQMAIDKAKQVGSGWVSIGNSNHFGIAAYHAMMALEHDMIGFAFTNASPLVAPTHSMERLLGTNPMCYAIPGGKEQPVIVDMATSAAANGKLEIAQRKGEQVPSGWVQDKDGKYTTDPHALKAGGALLPLGSDRHGGSHKGYGLSAVVDIFSAVLSGANYGPWVPPFVSFLPLADDMPGKGLGHFVGAMRVDGFRPVEEYKENIDKWIRRFKTSTPVEGYDRVIVPGEPEFEIERERKISGIPLLQPVIDDLMKVGDQLGVEF